MSEYKVIFSEGNSKPNDFGGKVFGGIQSVGIFEANSRVDVFLEMHKRYAELGMDLTVFSSNGSRPLDFTYEELKEIYDRKKITVKSGFPVKGAQIQSIKLNDQVAI